MKHDWSFDEPDDLEGVVRFVCIRCGIELPMFEDDVEGETDCDAEIVRQVTES